MRLSITKSDDKMGVMREMIRQHNPHAQKLGQYPSERDIQDDLAIARERLEAFKKKTTVELESEYEEDTLVYMQRMEKMYSEAIEAHQRAVDFKTYIQDIVTGDDLVDAAIASVLQQARATEKSTFDTVARWAKSLTEAREEEKVSFEDWLESGLLYRESRVGSKARDISERRSYQRAFDAWNEQAVKMIDQAKEATEDAIPL